MEPLTTYSSHGPPYISYGTSWENISSVGDQFLHSHDLYA